MKPHDFLQRLDEARIVEAIQSAERKTSGEVRVFVTSRELGEGQCRQARRLPI